MYDQPTFQQPQLSSLEQPQVAGTQQSQQYGLDPQSREQQGQQPQSQQPGFGQQPQSQQPQSGQRVQGTQPITQYEQQPQFGQGQQPQFGQGQQPQFGQGQQPQSQQPQAQQFQQPEQIGAGQQSVELSGQGVPPQQSRMATGQQATQQPQIQSVTPTASGQQAGAWSQRVPQSAVGQQIPQQSVGQQHPQQSLTAGIPQQQAGQPQQQAGQPQQIPVGAGRGVPQQIPIEYGAHGAGHEMTTPWQSFGHQETARQTVEMADTPLLADVLARRLGLTSQQLAQVVPQLGVVLGNAPASGQQANVGVQPTQTTQQGQGTPMQSGFGQ